jgi:UDP-N-acetylmuramoylalanine--D-glutamate ligase
MILSVAFMPPIKQKAYAAKTSVVVGAGLSGRAVSRLLHDLGAKVRIVDRNPEGVSDDFAAEAERLHFDMRLGDHKPEDFADADLIVLSPGVPAAKIKSFFPERKGLEVVAEMELAARFVSEPIIAVTGTSGKTTTTAVIGHVLEKTGRTTFVGGNIGTPLSAYVSEDQSAEVVVLEVSSFQGQNLTSFAPDVGIFLNLAPNHLDYHADMDEYLEAKLNIFRRMGPDALLVLPAEMKAELEGRDLGKARIEWFTPRGRFEPCLNLPGKHNQANLEAAFMALQHFGITAEDVAEALNDFRPFPHRLELVAEGGGVTFVNDSKATTLHSAAAAIEAYDRPILLLAGGVFKGGDPTDLLPVFKDRVKAVGLFGKAGERFEAAWKDAVPCRRLETLAEAMQSLMDMAEPGDVMLLSPATSSFDQYPNYGARGEDFRAIALELAQGLQTQEAAHGD